MKHLFTSYEISLLAKEKGFDEDCLASYVQMSEDRFDFMLNDKLEEFDREYSIGDNLITNAPLFQQLVDWLREKHNLSIELSVFCDKDYKSEIFQIESLDSVYVSKKLNYYEALNKAIIKSFKLI